MEIRKEEEKWRIGIYRDEEWNIQKLARVEKTVSMVVDNFTFSGTVAEFVSLDDPDKFNETVKNIQLRETRTEKRVANLLKLRDTINTIIGVEPELYLESTIDC